MLNLKEIGNRIKKYRKQKGFTQAQLAFSPLLYQLSYDTFLVCGCKDKYIF